MDNILHSLFTECNHGVYQQCVDIQHNQVMKPDYKRLLEAARSLKGWETPSEICANLTRSGYAVTEQMMTNWKSRGISRDGQLRTSKIIGCSPHWLETGEGKMAEDPPLSRDESILIELYRAMTPEKRRALLTVSNALSQSVADNAECG